MSVQIDDPKCADLNKTFVCFLFRSFDDYSVPKFIEHNMLKVQIVILPLLGILLLIKHQHSKQSDSQLNDAIVYYIIHQELSPKQVSVLS